MAKFKPTPPPNRVAKLAEDGRVIRSKPGVTVPDGWQDLFLEKLRESGMVREAAKAVGISKTHAYRVKARDAAFAERWDEAIDDTMEVLEQVVLRRAIAGSDQLAMFILRAHRPEKYKDNVEHRHEHSGAIEGKLILELPDGTQPIEIPAVRRREAARLLMQNVEEAEEDIPEADVVEEP